MFPSDTKILVVDDMRTMRIIVKKALAELNLTNVVEADDGATAWPEIEKALASAEPFRLVITDWNMPQVKGIDLLKQIRANAKTKDLPVIFVTAETEKSQVMEAVKAGVTNFVSKPFTPAALKEKLAAVYAKMNQGK